MICEDCSRAADTLDKAVNAPELRLAGAGLHLRCSRKNGCDCAHILEHDAMRIAGDYFGDMAGDSLQKCIDTLIGGRDEVERAR